jgi:hypothetical protein
MNPHSATRATHPHIDTMYYHQSDQINFWLPFTDEYGNNSLWVDHGPFNLDHESLVLREGQIARFYGNRSIHFTVSNDHTRITTDFRAVPGILFDSDNKLSHDKFGGHKTLLRMEIRQRPCQMDNHWKVKRIRRSICVNTHTSLPLSLSLSLSHNNKGNRSQPVRYSSSSLIILRVTFKLL